MFVALTSSLRATKLLLHLNPLELWSIVHINTFASPNFTGSKVGDIYIFRTHYNLCYVIRNGIYILAYIINSNTTINMQITLQASEFLVTNLNAFQSQYRFQNDIETDK